MRSDKPKAKPFRQWVVNEVLPRIRKTGEYSLKQALPKNYEEALEHLLAQVKENKKLQQERTVLLQSEIKLKRLMHSGLTYTSTQIAKELGLSSAKELHRILNIANIIYKSGGVSVTYARYTFEDDAKKILINKSEIINNEGHIRQ